MLQQLDRGTVGPVPVLELEHDRPRRGERGQPGPDRAIQRRLQRLRVQQRQALRGLRVRFDTRERGEKGGVPAGHAQGERLGDERGPPRFRPRPRADLLRERPVAGRIPRLDAAAAQPQHLRRRPHLRHQSRLPDAWLALDQHDRAGTLRHIADDRPQLAQLALPADQTDAAGRRDGNGQGPDYQRRAHRGVLPLQAQRWHFGEHEPALGGRARPRADDDRHRLGGGLQTRRRVHHVARGKPVVLCGVADEGLARLDGHPDLQSDLVRADPLDDVQGRPDRAFGIVLVREWKAEQRRHGVADELLDGPAVTLDRLARQPVVTAQQPVDLFRIRPLGQLCRPDQIAEQRGHDPPFRRRHRLIQPRAAPAAEQRIRRYPSTAGPAAHRLLVCQGTDHPHQTAAPAMPPRKLPGNMS